jgi:hypothetical protein
MERGTRGGASRSGESGHAFVIWAKVPATAGAARASVRPAPYNAIGRGTRGEAAAPDVAFDLSHPLP